MARTSQSRKDKARRKKRRMRYHSEEKNYRLDCTIDDAFSLLESGDTDGALQLFRHVAQRRPHHHVPWQVMLDLAIERGDHALALEASMGLHKIFPDAPMHWQNVISAHASMQQTDQALLFFRQTVQPRLKGRNKPKLTREQSKFFAHVASIVPVDAKVPNLKTEKPSKAASAKPKPALKPKPKPPLPEINLSFDFRLDAGLKAAQACKPDTLACELRLAWERFGLLAGYDELLCLPELRDVRRYAYQVQTVRRVLSQFRGRVLLADEVGLGKTIEAGMVLKEYVMRDLVRSALILVPASLVGQWVEELSAKFGLPFDSTDNPACRKDPTGFWAQPWVVASVATARRKPHLSAITGREYDLVIVDEAHMLRNRTTAAWKLVNTVKKRFHRPGTTCRLSGRRRTCGPADHGPGLHQKRRPGSCRKAAVFLSRGTVPPPEHGRHAHELPSMGPALRGHQ